MKGGCYTRGCDVDVCTQTEVCVTQECIPKKCLGVTCPGDQRCAADGKCYDRGGAGGGPGTGPGPGMVPQATGGGSAAGNAGAGNAGAGNAGAGSSGAGSSGAGSSGAGSSGAGSSGAGSSGAGSSGAGSSGAGSSGAGTGGSGAGTGGSGAGTGGSGAGPGTMACQGRCSPTQVCINNVCTEARCVGVTCPMGQACAQGSCVATGCGASGATCPAGQACGSAGTCVSTACATVTCPNGYGCSSGLCIPALPDGGTPLLPDGGPAVVIGPDGGIIGVPLPDGGLATLPDGGVVGGPCLPWQCTEVSCDNGIDDNLNGLVDCADPSCGGQRCNDGNPCTYNELCQVGSCNAQTQLTCNTPPAGPCWQQQGTCMPDATCLYSPNFSGTCQTPGEVCRPGGMCGPAPGIQFGFTPANVNPAMLPRFVQGMVSISGSASFNSNGNTFAGGWSGRPVVQDISTPTGPAVVLIFDQLLLNAGSNLRLVGNKPVIFLAYTGIAINTATIDASGYGTTPGPAGNLNCGTSAGGNGTTNNQTAAGAGGAGSFKSAGAPGGGGSTFTTGGVAGTLRSRGRFDLIGGCPGGTGGGAQGGVGGAGGGAFQLIARYGIIMDDSRLLVSGAGGSGAGGQSTQGPGGGGGGGSGGSIVIQAPYIIATRSMIVSNGGGGGEGAGIVDLGFVFGGGRDGQNGNVIPGFAGAAGGSGSSYNGGNGGNGGALYSTPGAGAPGSSYFDSENNGRYEAGGGGGGGAGGHTLIDLVTTSIAGFSTCEVDRNETVLSPTRDVPLICG